MKILVTGDIGGQGQAGRCRVGENMEGEGFYRCEACVERNRDVEKG